MVSIQGLHINPIRNSQIRVRFAAKFYSKESIHVQKVKITNSVMVFNIDMSFRCHSAN